MWLCAGGGASAGIPGDPHLQHSLLRVKYRGFTRLGKASPYQRSGIDSSAGGFKNDSLAPGFPRSYGDSAAGCWSIGSVESQGAQPWMHAGPSW